MKRSALQRSKPMRSRPKPKRQKPLVAKRLGESAVDKGLIRDREHMGRVAAQRCLVCGLAHPQVHHIRECFPRTMGVKVGDDKTVPLCPTHHAELHTFNTVAFWQKYRIDPVKWAAAFYAETLALRRATA